MAGLIAAPVMQLHAGEAGWSYYGGDKHFDRYSPADLINSGNIDQVKIIWSRPAIDPLLAKEFPDLIASEYFRGTPILIDGILYAPNGVGLVEAFDALSGETVWVQKPFEATLQEAAGISTRGVDYWASGADRRIIVTRGDYLYALNAATGAAISSFGEGGRVSLRRPRNPDTPFVGLNGPIVVGDVIVVSGNGGGHGAGDGGTYREGTPEDVRGYDVRSGKHLWTFHVMPRADEPGRDTWGGDSADFVGHMGAWASMSADLERGIVYLPLTAPTNAYYGGHRPGDNLYANSLVALDVKTGKPRWHFQMVHHDLWDYDNASPPVLGTLHVDGKSVDAVMQANKTGYIFVFDRVTGKPIWPIVERPVPQSKVPGEQTSPTQPIPTRPEPFDRQGITESDLIDFTPELNAKAKEIVKLYELGPVFTPPALRDPSRNKRGVLMVPGAWGTGNWNTSAFDPETGYFYAVSMTLPGVFALDKNNEPEGGIAYHWPRPLPDDPKAGLYGIGPDGLPLLKPPYGRITAYDMNKGKKLWVVANGDGPRDHPLLKGLKLPQLGSLGRPVPLVTKSLLFLGESSDALYGKVGKDAPAPFRAYDKKTGKVLWSTMLPAGTTGGPVTYEVKGQQVIIVPVGDKSYGGGWIALGIPSSDLPVQKFGKKEAVEGVLASFSAEQATKGDTIYQNQCAVCHGSDLKGGGHAPPLTGEGFLSAWAGKPARGLYSRIISTMPMAAPGTLSPEQTLALVALIGRTNGLPQGAVINDPAQLDGMVFPAVAE
ncbi:hypothetical protein B2G71_08520 [Novosphingobium sp. PC22D]|nr:hypothetical protein B2G71_08520 [Novosphingobium sp. PC22D]